MILSMAKVVNLIGFGLILVELPYYCFSEQLHNILAVLPLEHSRWPTHSWERGLEILPGAQVAIEHINQKSNILNDDHTLALKVIDIRNCKNELNEYQLTDFINVTLYHDVNAIGVIGLFCPPSDQLLSHLAIRIQSSEVILSSALSVTHPHDQVLSSPRYFRILQRGDTFVSTLLSLADRLSWSRIAVVAETRNVYILL